MIIKSTRLQSASVTRFLAPHLLDGGKNDAVRILAGGRDHLRACIAAAEVKECRYAVRHFVIAPEQPIGHDGALWVANRLAEEFGFRPGAWTLVEHEKQKVRGREAPHFHLAVAEVDPDTNGGKVLSSGWTYPRQEKIARLAEVHFGHRLTPGPHHAGVVRRLDAEGDTIAADAMRDATPARGPTEGRRTVPPSAMAAMDAAGIDSGAALDRVREAFEVSANSTEFGDHLASMGLHVGPGTTRKTTLCLYAGEKPLGALHRILGVSGPEMRGFMREPAPITLTIEEVHAEIQSQRVASQPEAEDRTKADGYRGKLDSIHTMTANQEAKNTADEDERETLMGQAGRFGWIARKFTRKADYASTLAKVAALDRAIVDRQRFVREWREKAAPIKASMQEENRRLEARAVYAAEKHGRELARLASLEAVITSGGIVFADLEELRAFLSPTHGSPDDPSIVLGVPGKR